MKAVQSFEIDIDIEEKQREDCPAGEQDRCGGK
jgi:hypothetical protein